MQHVVADLGDLFGLVGYVVEENLVSTAGTPLAMN